MRFIFLLIILSLTACTRPDRASVLVEPASDAVAHNGALREAIGIETLGGVFTPLLAAGCPLPCSLSQTFSTAEDGQSEILLHLYRGTGPRTATAHSLGTFRISGIPSMPRGTPGVVVEFIVDQSGVRLTAVDRDGNAKLQIARVKS